MHKHISASRSTIDDSSGHGGGLEEFSPVVDMQHESSTPGLHLAHLDRHSRSRCASCSLRFLRGRATRHGTSIGPAITASGIGPAHHRGRPAVVSHDNRTGSQRVPRLRAGCATSRACHCPPEETELIGPLSDTTILHLIKIETTYAQVPDLGVDTSSCMPSALMSRPAKRASALSEKRRKRSVSSSSLPKAHSSCGTCSHGGVLHCLFGGGSSASSAYVGLATSSSRAEAREPDAPLVELEAGARDFSPSSATVIGGKDDGSASLTVAPTSCRLTSSIALRPIGHADAPNPPA